MKHVDRPLCIIRVGQGKGCKDRHVVLSPELPALLREWWKVRRPLNDDGVPVAERWLFPGRGDDTHLTARPVNPIKTISDYL